MNNENSDGNVRGAWGYDVDSAEFVRELRGGAKRKEMYMQNENKDTSNEPNSAFKSKYNPKPDPHDMSISTLAFEANMKAYKAIECLAAVDHDQWQFWSMQIMKDLDELITVIISLNKVCENLPSYHLSGEKDRVQQIIKKHNERNARWQNQWCAYTHLPEDVKEHDRLWAKKEYEKLQKKECWKIK